MAASAYLAVETLYASDDILVTRAIRASDGQRVILKSPHIEHLTRRVAERLQHEYDVASQLAGEHVVRVLAMENHGGAPTLVFQDDGGDPLRWRREAPMDIEQFLRLASAIATAVSSIHAQNVIHRDLKPSNIIVIPGSQTIKLTDFGIASVLSAAPQVGRPPRLLEGTLAYMAPEQTGRMNRAIDQRTDLYALGMVFYEMLVGQPPFHATDAVEWIHCHIARVPPSPIELRPDIPTAVADVVMKLLAKMAEDRYQSASGLRYDLQQCLSQWQHRGRVDSFVLGARDIAERLQLPQKLYGRQEVVATLIGAFQLATQTRTSGFLLVSGEAGIGKSALIQELHRPIVERHGHFLAGKFEQFERDIPYGAIVQGMQSLVREVLAKPEPQVAAWRYRLGEALGINGPLLVGIIPQLALILGPQEPATLQSPVEAHARFKTAVRSFFWAFTDPEHPVVLFLDDLQWADSDSLDLLTDLVGDPDIKGLLLVGATRSDEDEASRALSQTLDRIRGTGAAVSTITVEPLAPAQLAQLLADTLCCDGAVVAPLVRLIHAKTAGNPFFVNQFLIALYQDGLLTFDTRAPAWRWDIEKIAARGYTDNVAELMVDKLARLTPSTREALMQMACLGRVADVALFALASGRTSEELTRDLAEAEREGLLYRAMDAFEFLHDRIHLAAYSLIPAAHRSEFHLQLGRSLLARLPPEQIPERLFGLVHQFHEGAALITDPDERLRVAELSLTAGRKAKSTTAYAIAVRYLAAGMSLLPAASFAAHHDLAFGLFLERAQCEYLTGGFAQAEALLDEAMRHARDNIERTAVYEILIQLLTTKGENARAVEATLSCLALFDLTMPREPTEEQVRQAYDDIRAALGDRPIEALLDLPVLTDRAIGGLLNVLLIAQSALMFTNGNLLVLAICHMVRLSLRYGNIASAIGGYGGLGTWYVGPALDMWSDAFRFAEVSRALVERRGLAEFRAQVYLSCAVLSYRVHPARKALPILEECRRAASATCDLMYACYERCHELAFRLILGDPLDEVYARSELYLDFLRKSRFDPVADVIIPQQRLIQSLRGLTTSFSTFDDEHFSEAAFEAHLREKGLPIAACWYFMYKLKARFWSGDYEAAAAAGEMATRVLWASPNSFWINPEFYFFEGLVAASCHDTADEAQRAAHRQKLAQREAQFRAWAAICPENFEPKAALLAAESARLLGQELAAAQQYERAIATARAQEFVHCEGLAWELASRFYRRRGFETIAKAYLRKARSSYERWGAQGKVRQLDQDFPRLVTAAESASPSTSAVTTMSEGGERLDLMSIVKASQTIAGEIVPEKLFGTLMRVLIENAGARRAALLLPGASGTLVVAAEADSESAARLDRMPLPAWEAGPRSLVQYVERTRETVVLGDASLSAQFRSDPYFARQHARSVLCMPVLNQGTLSGVLYLENEVAADVFSETRLAVLRILAGQVAISLENARLYQDLETAMNEARKSERLKTQFLAVTTHELRTPLNAIINVPAGLLRRFAPRTEADCARCGSTFQLEPGETVDAATSCPACNTLGLRSIERSTYGGDLSELATGLKSVERSGRHLLQIVNGILDLSRLESGYVSPAFQPVELRALLMAIEQIAAPLSREQGVVLHFAGPAEGATIEADPLMLRQILTNIVGNAIKFSRPSSRVEITCAQDQEEWVFTVRDQGIGIHAEQLPGIFESFRQADASLTRSRGGTGLGLAITRRLVLLHHGTIKVQSAVGEGSTFVVRLPCKCSAPQPKAADASAAWVSLV